MGYGGGGGGGGERERERWKQRDNAQLIKYIILKLTAHCLSQFTADDGRKKEMERDAQ